ncbi:abnormal spindle-like microcephaly-associated protein homolog [Striga asiatica]|uniref:Abnormal spindle-like microcephaly-associated protein homolog n=1 Tax=Striga asiatica TaxID=4170 RepID=A0A5A7QH93_STRAF|nr:abnormal spindle-like microcephaly-associated protein homolog [Striga asiatica]
MSLSLTNSKLSLSLSPIQFSLSQTRTHTETHTTPHTHLAGHHNQFRRSRRLPPPLSPTVQSSPFFFNLAGVFDSVSQFRHESQGGPSPIFRGRYNTSSTTPAPPISPLYVVVRLSFAGGGGTSTGCSAACTEGLVGMRDRGQLAGVAGSSCREETYRRLLAPEVAAAKRSNGGRGLSGARGGAADVDPLRSENCEGKGEEVRWMGDKDVSDEDRNDSQLMDTIVQSATIGGRKANLGGGCGHQRDCWDKASIIEVPPMDKLENLALSILTARPKGKKIQGLMGQKVNSGSSQMGEGASSALGKGDLVLYDVAQQSRTLWVIAEETTQIGGMEADQIGTVAIVPMGEENLHIKNEGKTGNSKRTWKRIHPKEGRLIRDCGVVIKKRIRAMKKMGF